MRPSLLLAAIASLAFCASVRAELPALDWRAPAGCPDADAVRAYVSRTVEAADRPPVRALRAKVVAAGGAYRLDLSIETGETTHQRRLYAERCDTFVELVALELGLSALPAGIAPTPAPPPRAPLAWSVRAGAGAGIRPRRARLRLGWRRAGS